MNRTIGFALLLAATSAFAQQADPGAQPAAESAAPTEGAAPDQQAEQRPADDQSIVERPQEAPPTADDTAPGGDVLMREEAGALGDRFGQLDANQDGVITQEERAAGQVSSADQLLQAPAGAVPTTSVAGGDTGIATLGRQVPSTSVPGGDVGRPPSADEPSTSIPGGDVGRER